MRLTPQDVKDSKIYNEQNFFQRAAKKDRVEKWKKLHSLPLLGVPSCIGFGLHADKYRFLVFSDLGRSLQSILNDGLHLNEKATFQIAVRLLDCLEYLHENEYVHGDITADNIYVNPADLTQVTLAGYYFAFRYCPEGKHVARREGSRTPHEGTIEFISQDSHKGAGALQSYLQQVMALEYEEKPNYEALRQLFKKPLQTMKTSAYDSVDIMIVP
ncbi:UNVERIFIED_CONTAM: hypothetical protein H355_014757 [Colinus virginianus]|nr:hypothetical protein H355_014757 [Colinus virginianus]